MRGHPLPAIALIALIALELLACRGTTSEHGDLPPRGVRVAEVNADEPGGHLPYAGGLEPRVRIDLAFGITGRVKSVGQGRDRTALHEGDLVKRGQLLAQLDDRDLELQASSAAFAASSAEAELAAARTGAEQAESELGRARKLAGTGALATAELERADSTSKAAQAKLAAAREQARVKADQAALSRRVVTDARLVSPIDGVVARRMVDPGENVAPSTVAFTLIDPVEMRLVFAVPDVRIGAVQIGQLVPVHVDALPDVPLVGRVSTIHPVADPSLRTFDVELTLDNASGKLRAGMVASATLPDGVARGGVRVPLASVVRSAEGDLVVYVFADGRAKARKVSTDDIVGNDVRVVSGLQKGERVVTDGAAYLHDGERVEVAP